MHVTSASMQVSAVVGWYNPLNGVTAAGGNAGEDSYDSFIFNFTTDRILRPEFYPFYSEDQRVSNVYAGSDLVLSERPGYAESYMDTFSDSLSYSGYPHGLLWNPTHRLPFESYVMTINDLAVYSISVDSLASAAAVPEPATWAMMIVGFGLTGCVLRRRRISTKVSFA
ncbi:PEP-CTERM sorting domain-containing protein [Sphingomonas aliaeris]|uniref:PEP-CTERM sorting domain-containing protein n=2 Tax=Sphingomonas aliaeris TaxID=2759526 RepID=A0A974NXR0_9SPHN|nr:PEP-CTERM sorting domain-containing protein [Sphingomonas aliaeris]